jgi:hypothetical protein
MPSPLTVVMEDLISAVAGDSTLKKGRKGKDKKDKNLLFYVDGNYTRHRAVSTQFLTHNFGLYN